MSSVEQRTLAFEQRVSDAVAQLIDQVPGQRFAIPAGLGHVLIAVGTDSVKVGQRVGAHVSWLGHLQRGPTPTIHRRMVDHILAAVPRILSGEIEPEAVR